jgi:hypothetical protein
MHTNTYLHICTCSYIGPNPLPQGKANEVLVQLDPSYNPVWTSGQEIEALHRFHYKIAK